MGSQTESPRCHQATSPGPEKFSTKLSYSELLILTSQFIKGGWGNAITMDRAFGTSLEVSVGG